MVKSVFCTKVKPVSELGQDIFNVLPEGVIVNADVGAELPWDWIGFATRPMKRMLSD